MKKIFLIVLLGMGISVATQGQAPTDASTVNRAQNVFVEIGGQGLLFSANYDTRFSKRRDGLGGRAGIGYTAFDGDRITTIPIGVNYLLGKGRNFFEVGVGATVIMARLDDSFLFDDGEGDGVLGTMSFSYRLQPVDSGFALRAGITPVFGKGGFIPYYFGVSIGYTF